jgi:4a-hydroxytetrahydrobiopterin dehydratase
MPQTVPEGWIQEGNALARTVARADFVEALALTVEIGRLAEAANHHPDINIHRYRHVRVTLTTHSAANTVTEKDFALAQQINDLSEDRIRHSTGELRRQFQA